MRTIQEQKEQLAKFKPPGWGTSEAEWLRLQLEILLDIKRLLIKQLEDQ